MSVDLSGFDANQVDPNEGFSAIPAGDYEVIIIDSSMKPTKANDGEYLELKLQILNGPHQNRTLVDRLNLKNKNDMAVQISKRTLSAICRAVGVMTPESSGELHNKPLVAVVKTRKDDDGNMQNDVKGYKARHTQSGQASPADQGSKPARTSPF